MAGTVTAVREAGIEVTEATLATIGRGIQKKLGEASAGEEGGSDLPGEGST
jgi:hypothetical protein